MAVSRREFAPKSCRFSTPFLPRKRWDAIFSVFKACAPLAPKFRIAFSADPCGTESQTVTWFSSNASVRDIETTWAQIQLPQQRTGRFPTKPRPCWTPSWRNTILPQLHRLIATFSSENCFNTCKSAILQKHSYLRKKITHKIRVYSHLNRGKYPNKTSFRFVSSPRAPLCDARSESASLFIGRPCTLGTMNFCYYWWSRSGHLGAALSLNVHTLECMECVEFCQNLTPIHTPYLFTPFMIFQI